MTVHQWSSSKFFYRLNIRYRVHQKCPFFRNRNQKIVVGESGRLLIFLFLCFRECTSSGVFDGDMPHCDPRSCGVHPEVENGRLNTYEELFYGSKVFISCNEGYAMSGNYSRYHSTNVKVILFT